MAPPQIFNPLDKRNLGKSVADALIESSPKPLAEITVSPGAGIYAIYYHGRFKPYAPIVTRNLSSNGHPIYVGKAVPKGSRKAASLDASLQTSALSSRIIQHRSSIEKTSTLDLADFTYRSLVVDDIWIPLGEALMINIYAPLWNTVVDGFGNHDPGAGRYNGRRPLWDQLHPGRPWALKCQPASLSVSEIIEKIEAYTIGSPS